MIETEVKIAVDRRKFEAAIKDCFGDSFPEFKEERNIFYGVPSGFLRLRDYAGEILVTYKGKREEEGELNCREEIEFDYSKQDFEKLQIFFSKIGLPKYFEYTKKRANYEVEGGMSGGYFATISFDILPNGERYIEVEKKEAGGENIIENILHRLEIDRCFREKRSYLEIVKESVKNGTKYKN